MLEAMLHRQTGKIVLATPIKVNHAHSFERIRITEIGPSTVAIGQHAPKARSDKGESPLLTKGSALLIEGHIFGSFSEEQRRTACADEGDVPMDLARRLLRDYEGDYCLAQVYGKQLMVGRETLGVAPLYYGTSRALHAVSTERKALWRIGVRSVHSFPPGHLATINPKGFTFKPIRVITRPPQVKSEMNDAAIHLQKLLEESVSKRVRDVDKVGVAFSGGLDSTVIAFLARKCGVNVSLISVGLKNQPELAHAARAAKALGFSVKAQPFEVDDVEKALSTVLWLIEECNPMKVGVAIPLYWTAQIASSLKCHVLLAGQGADELFGGYHRYLATYERNGIDGVTKRLYEDTVSSPETNFQRDEPVCAFHKVDLRLPFVDTNVVRYALSLPVNLKIGSASDALRKEVLRRVALNLGIPDFIALKPKKAIQYATGVDKALRSLSRSKGLTINQYIMEAWRKIYPNLEGA
jgi:asparagine synthase (glutamine-hydrolysing)